MNNNLIKSFIIHARKYRETSMIYDVLTEEQGLISILAKGIKSKKDGFILQPFRELQLSYTERTLPLLTKYEIVSSYLEASNKFMLDGRRPKYLWVDILKGEINRVDLMGKKSDTLKLDQPVGAIALTEKGRVVAATPIGLVDALNGVDVSTFSNPDPKVRMNDGKADPCGRFVGGN